VNRKVLRSFIHRRRGIST